MQNKRCNKGRLTSEKSRREEKRSDKGTESSGEGVEFEERRRRGGGGVGTSRVHGVSQRDGNGYHIPNACGAGGGLYKHSTQRRHGGKAHVETTRSKPGAQHAKRGVWVEEYEREGVRACVNNRTRQRASEGRSGHARRRVPCTRSRPLRTKTVGGGRRTA